MEQLPSNAASFVRRLFNNTMPDPGFKQLMITATALTVLLTGSALIAQTPPADSAEAMIEPVRTAPSTSDDRILGMIPNYQTVSDPNAPLKPLTVRQKWGLFLRESMDPYNFATAAMGAALSQSGNNTPKYGGGLKPYLQRFGAASADLATQAFFSDAVLASVLHQDPRYYRMGPGHSVLRRTLYSMSRLVITRNDSGKAAFNFSGVGGMALGIGVSNLYYPRESVNGEVNGSRFITSITGASLGNLLPEFWPDFKQKFFHKK